MQNCLSSVAVVEVLVTVRLQPILVPQGLVVVVEYSGFQVLRSHRHLQSRLVPEVSVDQVHKVTLVQVAREVKPQHLEA
jgi:hypothetical protein